MTPLLDYEPGDELPEWLRNRMRYAIFASFVLGAIAGISLVVLLAQLL